MDPVDRKSEGHKGQVRLAGPVACGLPHVLRRGTAEEVARDV